MTDYREQAIKDVIAVARNHPDHMTTLDAYRSYARVQREARLRLEDALEELMFASRGFVSEAYIRDARAAIDAIKEG